MAAIFGRFSKHAELVLVAAQRLARELERPVGGDLLLVCIADLERIPAADLLRSNGVTRNQLLSFIVPQVVASEGIEVPTTSPELQDILEKAIREAAKLRFASVEVEHLLVVLCEYSGSAQFLLRQAGQKPEEIAARIREWLISISVMRQQQPRNGDMQKQGQGPDEDLSRFLTDLTTLAEDSELDPVVGREKEIEQMIQTLLRRRKNNPLLVGEPGVGKTALADGLAIRIARKAVPAALAHMRVLQLDLSLVVAGTMYRGQFEERLKQLISEIAERGNCILFVDEVHTLAGAGSAEGSFDAANILKPALARGELRLIGATTHDEYRKHIRSDAALDRRFEVIDVAEPSHEAAELMLQALTPKLEQFHQVHILDDAIPAAVELSARYLHDRFLPDKAIDILDQACALLAPPYKENKRRNQLEEDLAKTTEQKHNLVEHASSAEEWQLAQALSDKEMQLMRKLRQIEEQDRPSVLKPITRCHVEQIISQKSGVPLSDVQQALQPLRVAQVTKALTETILGQADAAKQIGQALLRSQLGFTKPGKPIASFLLVGPTGVGKTETARVLAREVFGSDDALVKIDMSEFMERHSTSTLVGAPAGYVGFEQGGTLTEQVRRKPYSVVLFDEVEKAHPDVFNLLLQMLEDGYLTDTTGQKTSFSNTLILLTSNIGMDTLVKGEGIGFSAVERSSEEKHEATKDHVEGEMKDFFRPEFLGRMSAVVHYNPLSKEVVAELIKRGVVGFQDHMLKKGCKVTISAAVRKFLGTLYEPEAGARSIHRIISEQLEGSIISYLTEHQFVLPDTLTFAVKDDAITVS